MTSGAETASLPPELAQPLPRRVRATGALKGFIALFTVLLLGTCLFLLGTIYSFHHNRSILRTSGAPIEGQITALEIERGKNSDSYRVSYRFQPPSGGADQRVQTGVDVVSEARYRSLHVDEIVPILYERNRPGNSGLKFDDSGNTSDDSTPMLLMALFIVGLFGGLSVLFAAILIVPYLKQKKLLQWGDVAFATILSEKENGRRPTTTVTYQFTDEKGRSFVGGVQNFPSAKRLGWPGVRKARDAAMKVPVAIYDSKNPENNMLYRAGSAICY